MRSSKQSSSGQIVTFYPEKQKSLPRRLFLLRRFCSNFKYNKGYFLFQFRGFAQNKKTN